MLLPQSYGGVSHWLGSPSSSYHLEPAAVVIDDHCNEGITLARC